MLLITIHLTSRVSISADLQVYPKAGLGINDSQPLIQALFQFFTPEMNTNYKALAQDTAIRELHLHQFQEQATPRNETPLQPQGTTEGEGPQASWRIH